MPAITGDPSVLLAVSPPDGGWTPRLSRTVTGGQVSRGSTPSPRLSSGVPCCSCYPSEILEILACALWSVLGSLIMLWQLIVDLLTKPLTCFE